MHYRWGNAVRTIRDELQQTYQYDLDKGIHYYKLLLDIYLEDPDIKQKLKDQRTVHICNEKSLLFSNINGFSLGGVQAWTKDICEALIKSGREDIYVISKKGDYDVPPLLEKNDFC